MEAETGNGTIVKWWRKERKKKRRVEK